jgi:hypothetical protein
MIAEIADSVPRPAGEESKGYAAVDPCHAPMWRAATFSMRQASAMIGNNDAGVEIAMSFINTDGLDELAKRLADSVPESLRAFGRDLESNFKAVLQAQLAKLDLVTRQDFDVQAAILERTQAKLSAIEARLKELEARLAAH